MNNKTRQQHLAELEDLCLAVMEKEGKITEGLDYNYHIKKKIESMQSWIRRELIEAILIKYR